MEFNLLQDQLQREFAAVPHQPVPQPQGSQPAAIQNQGGMMAHATQLGPGMGSQEMVTQANQLGPGVGTLMIVTPVREPRDPMAVPMVSPVPMQMVSPVPMQALGANRRDSIIPVSFQWSWSWCRDWTEDGCSSAYRRRP